MEKTLPSLENLFIQSWRIDGENSSFFGEFIEKM